MSTKDKKKAFLELYEGHSDSLFRYCFFKISDREKSIDIVQDSFTKLWGYLQTDEKIENNRAFLFKIANNLIIDWYRKRKSSSLDDLVEQGFEFEDEEPGQSADRLSDAKRAMEKLNMLEPSYREVLLLRYSENLSVTEIAETLGEKENTVSVRIHRAIDKLQKIFTT
jgi:RNA polymerase sigma-70 factor (ECF subfamily)